MATSVTHAAMPTTKTRLCARTEPGQHRRAPYTMAPHADATENAASSGPAQATPIARWRSSAGKTSSASAAKDIVAAPAR
jgi:hypothetical protein